MSDKGVIPDCIIGFQAFGEKDSSDCDIYKARMKPTHTKFIILTNIKVS